MKTIVFCAFMILSTLSYAQNENPISKFSLSVNPLGFVQFGPSLHAEIGLTDKLVGHVHLRAPALGVLSYVVVSDDELDRLTGRAAGIGLIYFPTDTKNKPYFGGMLGFQSTDMIYAQGRSDESWEKNKTTIFMCNGGYRFRMEGGFFINTGAYLGAAMTQWDWDYKNYRAGLGDNDARTGTTLTPFGMLELTVGFEF